jgi:signal transduction histidine kinase
MGLKNDKEKAIETVIREKDRILKATTEILAIAKKIEEEESLNSQDRFTIKTKINEIVSSLSIIAGFCDKDAQNLVKEITRMSIFNILVSDTKIDVALKIYLECFCTIVNSLTVDFNKTPFRFEAEFEMKVKELSAKIKTAYEKGKIESMY